MTRSSGFATQLQNPTLNADSLPYLIQSSPNSTFEFWLKRLTLQDLLRTRPPRITSQENFVLRGWILKKSSTESG